MQALRGALQNHQYGTRVKNRAGVSLLGAGEKFRLCESESARRRDPAFVVVFSALICFNEQASEQIQEITTAHVGDVW